VSVPAGALALAAFWSAGSMSRPDLPAVPPPPGLTAQTVAAAVQAAAGEKAPDPRPEASYALFLSLARRVLGDMAQRAAPQPERLPDRAAL
jgi:hypothetical protein